MYITGAAAGMLRILSKHVHVLKPISPVIDVDYFVEYFMLRTTIIAL